MKHKTFIALFVFSLTSCQSSHEHSSIKTVQLSTVVPKQDKTPVKTTEIEKLQLKTLLLPTFQVSRRRAELRQGPGIQFPLFDIILEEGSRLILLDSLGIWKKIWAIDQNAIGWVHHQTLKAKKFQTRSLSLDFNSIPRVFATRQINEIYDFSTKKPLRWQVQQGRSFPAINKKGKMVLVYIAETNSLAWLHKRDVQ